MKIKRAIDLRQQFQTRIYDVFSATVFFERSLDAHLVEMKRLVTETKEWKRMPQHCRSYLKGYETALWNSLYHVPFVPGILPLLEYVKIGPDGKQYRENDDSWLNQPSEYKSALTGKHAWRSSMNKGQPKFW